MKNLVKARLSVMIFLEFAVWGCYLISIGAYLASIGIGDRIGLFFVAQGIVSLFMPAFVGFVADRWLKPQRVFALCHILSALFIGLLGIRCASGHTSFVEIYPLYCLSILFFLPTVALANSISFSVLQKAGIDAGNSFPGIRMLGTIGFIGAMWTVNFFGIQTSYYQFILSAVIGLVLVAYSFTLPDSIIEQTGPKKSFGVMMGLMSFHLFKRKEMAVFFVFAMMLGVCLHISNGYTSPYIESFAVDPRFEDAFFVKNSILLISLSQISETLCLLLLPFCLRRLGIKKVIVISLLAWMVRYLLLGYGNPSSGVWMFMLSMVFYGIGFDFFNIAGSIFVDRNTDIHTRSCGQGLFMMMTNGFGSSIGMLAAQIMINAYTGPVSLGGRYYTVGDWRMAWLWCASFALVLALLFSLIFKNDEKDRVGN